MEAVIEKQKDFGQWLRKRINAVGLTPRQLAITSKVSEAEISRVIRAIRRPTIRTLQMIAPHLKVSMEELLTAASIIPVEQNANKERPHVVITGKSVDGRISKIVDGEDDIQDHLRGACAIEVHGDGNALAPDGSHVIYNPEETVRFGDNVYVKMKSGSPAFMKYISVDFQIKDDCVQRCITDKHFPIVLMPIGVNASPIMCMKDDIEYMYKIIAVHLP